MSEIKKQKLSDSIIKDFKDFAKTGEDPIFWLAKGKNYTIDEIITRMQSANILTVATLGVKTPSEWLKSLPPRKVRESVAPITREGGYSSFALIENESDYGKLRYPLVASFTSQKLPFASKTFPAYSSLVKKIKSSYKVKVIERKGNGPLFDYKKSGKLTAKLKNVGLGALNLCRKIFKKQILKPSPSYKGKIVINNSLEIGNNTRYIFSEQEKFTRIMYALTSLTSKDIVKKNKLNLDKKVMAFVDLYANVLVSRAVNYGSEASNRMMEASLSLQMCNTLAGLSIDSQTLKQASDIAMKTALYTINKLGISIQDVMNAMHKTGYTYPSFPQTLEEALVPKRTLVDEETFVNDAKHILGIEHKVQYENNDVLRNKKVDDVIYVEPTKAKEKEALDNPPPPPVIYAEPIKDNNQKEEEKEEKEEVKEKGLNKNELDVEDYVAWAENYGKVKDLPQRQGVKEKDVYLTKKSAEKYIDKVVLSAVKGNIETDLKKIGSSEDSSVATQRAKRRYNFLEHLYTYYDRNKSENTEALQDNIDKEFESKQLGDNIYAHSYAKSIVDLKQDIVSDIFGDQDKILKPVGKEIAAVVNDHTQEKYKSKLSAYVKGALKKCLRTVFKEIDSNNFEQKNLADPDASKNNA